MTDPRFNPTDRSGKGCDSCKHSTFKEGVSCLHPNRPAEKREVVRWFTGCPQHETNKD